LGLTQSFVVIFFSEIGDKTFIMVTLLAPQVNKFYLFLTASFAMSLMNCISVVIGAFFAYLIPKFVISIVVILLFTGFGSMLLYKSCAKKDAGEDDDEKREI
jgi:putative Ca2+/H+ antiporter (TMEM165/GDT1 family)